MILVEQHIIKSSNPLFKELDSFSFLSKNLYNSGLYLVRKHYFESKKFLNYYELNKLMVLEKNLDYYALPSKVSQQVLKMIEQNFKSFFKHLKVIKKGEKVRIPNYLDKVKGRFLLTYTDQAISLKKSGFIKLSKTNFYVKTDLKEIRQVRVVPGNQKYTIEILYNKFEKDLKPSNGKYCSIDLGVNNLITLGSNSIKPIIINGRPLKSINQYYNKRVAELKSKLIGNKQVSKRIVQITNKRNNKIKDYLHKSSRLIINHLVSNNINTLIIGNNKEWKQEINIGRRNNQNFVSIPHSNLINMLKYKAVLEGLNVIETEESYTSKCSFLDNEEVKKHKTYKGVRIKRGLFKSSQGKLINADLNGSLNILKKVVGEFQYPIEVCSTPVVLTIK